MEAGHTIQYDQYSKGCEKMNCFSCNIGSIIISILFGVIIGILFALGFLPFIVIAVFVALGLSIIALVFLFVAILPRSMTETSNACNCILRRNIGCFLAGIFGTLLSTIAVLSVGVISISIPAIILVAIAAIFFALLINNLIYLFEFLISKSCTSNNM